MLRILLRIIGVVGILYLPGCKPGTPEEWTRYVQGGTFEGVRPNLCQRLGGVLCSLPCTGHGDIYIIDLESTSLQQLTFAPEYECCPFDCRDTDCVYFERYERGHTHIWRVTSAGDCVRVTDGTWTDRLLDVSSDGRYIALVRIGSGGGKGLVGKSIILDVATNKQVSTGAVSADFTANGHRVYYELLQSPSLNEVWRLDIEANQRMKICEGIKPIVSSDETAVLCENDSGQAFVFDLKSQKRTLLGNGTAVFLGSTSSILLAESLSKKLFLIEPGGSIEIGSYGGDLQSITSTPDGIVIHSNLVSNRIGEVCIVNSTDGVPLCRTINLSALCKAR